MLRKKYGDFIPERQLNEQELKFVKAAERARRRPGGGRIVIAPKRGVDYTKTILEYLDYVYTHVYPTKVGPCSGCDLCVIADRVRDPALAYCVRRFRCRYSTPRCLYGCRGGTFSIIWIRTTEWNFYWLRVACEAIYLENALVIIQLVRKCSQVPDYFVSLEELARDPEVPPMHGAPPLPEEFLEEYERYVASEPVPMCVLYEVQRYENQRVRLYLSGGCLRARKA